MNNDFDYAVSVLTGQDKQFAISGEIRDTIFHDVLSSFNNKPTKIFQVGAIESFASRFRIGSGWSDIIFGKYIRQHGGTLTIVDIDLDHLANSALAAARLEYPLAISFGDAVEHIREGYDIYYLDGADVPLGNAQTLAQFKKIENTKSVVIVDDIKTKAVDLIEYLFKCEIPFDTHKVGNNSMITVDMRDSP